MQCEDASADAVACFKNRYVEAGRCKLVCGGEACDAGADDEHTGSLRSIGQDSLRFLRAGEQNERTTFTVEAKGAPLQAAPLGD